MTQSFDRRPSSRVTGALVLISAVLLAPVLSSAANAQTLGYASTQPNGYPTDEVIASDGIRNLRGQTKAAALCRRFGTKGFVYAGNDAGVWRTDMKAIARPRTTRMELFLSVLAPLAPMTRAAVAAAFQRHIHRSGLPLLGHSPYGLRHGFAMRLLERGVGIKAIGDLLGHRTLESTAVYLRLNTEALREVALPVPAHSSSLHEGRVS